MKKLLLSLTAVAALASAAAPAAAQSWRDHDRYERSWGGDFGGQRPTAYVDSLEWKIESALRYGSISRGEARSLLADLRQVQPIAWRVETGAARGWERQRLASVVDRIESAVNRPGRWARGYDRYDRDHGWRR